MDKFANGERKFTMLILGIGGSPRAGGNSDVLLDRALEGAESRGADTDKAVLNTLSFVPCQECDYTPPEGGCAVEDGFQAIYGKVMEADAVILASPIFFGSVSAQTKMMIDRFQCLWIENRRLGNGRPKERRPGAFISVEASDRIDFFANARAIVRNWFATIGVAYRGELFVTGVEEKGAILVRPGELKKAYDLGIILAAAKE